MNIEKYISAIQQIHTVQLTENEKTEIEKAIKDLYNTDNAEHFESKQESQIFFITLMKIYNIDLSEILAELELFD